MQDHVYYLLIRAKGFNIGVKQYIAYVRLNDTTFYVQLHPQSCLWRVSLCL